MMNFCMRGSVRGKGLASGRARVSKVIEGFVGVCCWSGFSFYGAGLGVFGLLSVADVWVAPGWPPPEDRVEVVGAAEAVVEFPVDRCGVPLKAA
jgi:hypothetical protein